MNSATAVVSVINIDYIEKRVNNTITKTLRINIDFAEKRVNNTTTMISFTNIFYIGKRENSTTSSCTVFSLSNVENISERYHGCYDISF